MDIEKLIERLKSDAADWAGDRYIKQDLLDAVEALATLQIELKGMRGAANSYKAENAKLQAELEKVKAERDAALHDMRRVGMSDDFCTFCTHCCIDGEPVYRPEEEYMAHCEKCDENYSQFEWRGPQKEE